MSTNQPSAADRFLRSLAANNPGEPEFLRGVTDFVGAVQPVLDRRLAYHEHRILERFVEPERTIIFRVPWQDDSGDIQVNRGFRIQFNSALGPCMGGIRFHSTASLGGFKLLAFEQTLRNSLTTLPIGGGHGGSDFDPKGRSDAEVMRFCQSFMTELGRHIGPDTDILTADIGVGGREIGYLFGQYKRLTNRSDAALLGKGLGWGGSLLRPEATGYGVAYFTDAMLAVDAGGIAGKRITISGAGPVALHAADKCISLGAEVTTLSDQSGFIVVDGGMSSDLWREIVQLKTIRRGRLVELAEGRPEIAFHEDSSIWTVPCDVALPCATQNELRREGAEQLIRNGCSCAVEGAVLSATSDAIEALTANGIRFGPGKAATAGGLAVSCLELSQNTERLPWPREEVDRRLREIVGRIQKTCLDTAAGHDRPGDYAAGADIAAFVRVGDAMIDQGLV